MKTENGGSLIDDRKLSTRTNFKCVSGNFVEFVALTFFYINQFLRAVVALEDL